MKRIQVKITDPSYLHRKMAAQLQQIAGKYTCDIYVVVGANGKTRANAKSLINLMTAYSKIKMPNGHIEVVATDWDDEDKAIKEIAEFFGVECK